MKALFVHGFATTDKVRSILGMIFGVYGPLFGGVTATFNLDVEFRAKGAHKISRKNAYKNLPDKCAKTTFRAAFKLQVIINFSQGKRL